MVFFYEQEIPIVKHYPDMIEVDRSYFTSSLSSGCYFEARNLDRGLKISDELSIFYGTTKEKAKTWLDGQKYVGLNVIYCAEAKKINGADIESRYFEIPIKNKFEDGRVELDQYYCVGNCPLANVFDDTMFDKTFDAGRDKLVFYSRDKNKCIEWLDVHAV